MFQAEVSSFALRLAAGGKAAKTIRTCAEAVQWSAAACLADHDGRGGREQVDGRDIQRRLAWLLDRYSSAYAASRYRAPRQFFKWLAAEDQLPGPMAALAPPRVPARPVPVFTPRGTIKAGAGVRGPAVRPAPRYRDQRGAHRGRHPAVRARRPAVRPRRPAVQRHRPVAAGDHRPRHGRQGPHRQDRPLGRHQPGPVPARPRPARPGPPAPAVARTRGREPLTAAGIYQMTARRGRQAGVAAYPHRFRHHFSRT